MRERPASAKLRSLTSPTGRSINCTNDSPSGKGDIRPLIFATIESAPALIFAAAAAIPRQASALRTRKPLGVDSLEAYLDELASSRPTPGGGSAATIVGALGAALVAMVARITHEPALVERADDVRARLLSNRTADELAFGAVVDAQALPRGSDAEKAARATRLQAALRTAAEVPLHSAQLAREVLALALEAAELPNRNLVSDAGCAAEFAAASVRAAAYNVRANHPYLKDRTLVADQAAQLDALESQTAELLDRARRASAGA
jgi:formiminotetrahydrofolate cyclodeaminase